MNLCFSDRPFVADFDFGSQAFPDFLIEFDKIGVEADFGDIARTGQMYWKYPFDRSGRGGQHNNPIRQGNRFFEIMRDKNH